MNFILYGKLFSGAAVVFYAFHYRLGRFIFLIENNKSIPVNSSQPQSLLIFLEFLI